MIDFYCTEYRIAAECTASGSCQGYGRKQAIRLLMLTLLCVLTRANLFSQIMTVGNDTATPIAGVGHDYRQMLSETVSPANGSLSVRISAPVPTGRGVTVPFSFNYDSAGVHHLTMGGTTSGVGHWITGSDFLNSGGWSYGIPLLTSTFLNVKGQQSNNQGSINCGANNDFVFTNSSGERNAFINLTWFLPSAPPNCPTSTTSASSRFYSAHITDNNSGIVRVSDHDGTIYTFNQSTSHASPNAYTSALTALPSGIEDRNGNELSMLDSGGGAFSLTDASGRTAIASSGFGSGNSTLTVSGLSAYQVAWAETASTFTVGSTMISGNGCGGIDGENGTQWTVTSITLPNGQTYQFQYDGTYGLLKKITYPNGAYSKYVWDVNPLSDAIIWPNFNGAPYTCTYKYDTPAVKSRIVSFDGSNEVLQEDYAYSTTWSGAAWTSKTTTVTTTVRTVQPGGLQALGSFDTVYTYTPTPAGQNQYDAASSLANTAPQLPQEQSIVYKDYGGLTLRTVTKNWASADVLNSQTNALDDGTQSQTAYTYDPSSLEILSQSDYDLAPGAPGGLLKKTAYSYQSFGASPLLGFSTIVDRPCKAVVYDASGTTSAAETDYFYDGGTVVCGTAGSAATSPVLGLTGHDETNYKYSSVVARGNITKVTRVLLPSGGVTESYGYDETGHVISKIDANNHTSQFSYLDSYASGYGSPSGQSNTYLTQIILPSTAGPIAHNQSFSYQYSDGQLASTTDENSQTTSYTYNDLLGRLKTTSFPDGGQTTNNYSDADFNPYVITSAKINASTTMASQTTFDGAGQVILKQLTSDPSGIVTTATTYDGLGRIRTVSNPYRSINDSTYGSTTYTYDALGRIRQTLAADSSLTKMDYSGASTTVTDAMQRVRKSTTDGLGRLSGVIEDPGTAPTHLNYVTSYGYDALNNLKSTNQSGQTRSFKYDSLSRLVGVINPENSNAATAPLQSCGGNTYDLCYAYDNVGNLFSKTDNRGAVVSYTYDVLNRVSGKSYTNPTSVVPSPSVTFCYDGYQAAGCPALTGVPNAIGRLTAVTSSNSTTTYPSYDAMGRVLSSAQVTGGKNYGFTYSYNLAGSLLTEKYPSGRTVATSYDAADRVTSVQGTIGSTVTNYIGDPATPANFVQYWPHGAAYYYPRGNGVEHAESYNSRLQVVESYEAIGNVNSASKMLFVSCPNWGLNVNNSGLYDLCPHVPATTANNGNLQGYVERMGGPGSSTLQSFTQAFGYDAVNRLKSAVDSGGWSRMFHYDAGGNMWVDPSYTGSTLNVNTTTTNNYNSHNQRTDQSYDAAGNLLQQLPGLNLGYDAESRQVSAGSYSYSYDGDGRRVEKVGGGATTVYVYDAAGRMVAEYSTGTETPSCVTCYLSYDHLGSTRLVTDAAGKVVARHDYLPFGEELGGNQAGRNMQWGITNDSINQKFTAKERDSESGLDYFGARYYGSALGRFTSPDEFKGGFDDLDGQAAFSAGPIPYADISDPQTLNKYVYVRNNPLRYVDPNGHCIEDLCIGEGALVYAGYTALAGATAAYLASPSGQQAIQATGQLIQSGLTGIQNLVTQATGNNSQQASPPPATGTGQSDAGSVPKEGVYNFPDATAPGKTYVGQSGNVPQRLSQHESSGKLAPGTEVTTQEVPGGKTSRELAEQQKINSLGGTKSQPGSKTSNVRNPVSPERLKKLTDGSNQDE